MHKNLVYKLWLLFLTITSFNLLAEIEHKTLRVSRKMNERPAIMPVGIINIDTKAQWSRPNIFGIEAGSQFGIVKSIEGHFSYDGIKLNFDDQKKLHLGSAFRLGGKYNYINVPHTSFAATVNLPIYVVSENIIQDITFGLPITFYNDIMALGFLDSLLTIKMRPKSDTNITLKFPLWYGIQAYGDLWLSLSSSVGNITMSSKPNSLKAIGFWEELPITLSGTYGLTDRFDLGANLGFSNIFKAKESLEIGITLSTRLGKLFS